MPNHITNVIEFHGDKDRIRAMLSAIAMTNEDIPAGVNSIDFNKVIPMPNYVFKGDIGKTERKQFGRNNWYDWSVEHWGTKWNSYGYHEQYDNPNILTFDTAWSAPHPVIQKLSELYPDITIEHSWTDEDIGYNCGSRTYLEGECIDEYFPDGKAAIDFACEVKGDDPSELDLVANQTDTQYINIEAENFELIELLDKQALFTNERLNAEDVPQGLYLYHLRMDDEQDHFTTIEPYVKVNHGGSVITKEPIDFGDADHIAFTEDTSPNFIGEELTFGQFMRGDFEQSEGMGGM